MSPSSREREREYARRRYEKWAAKQAQRELERRKARRNAIVAGGAVVAVLAIVLGAVALTGRSGSTSPVGERRPRHRPRRRPRQPRPRPTRALRRR